MQFQPNWETIKKRMLAFWDGEIIDRVMFYIEAPRNGVKKKEVTPPPTPEERAMNIGYQVESQMARIEATYYGADAIPSLEVAMGPSTSSVLFGAKPHFTEETIWVTPVINEWTDFKEQTRMQRDNRFWKLMEERARRSAQAARGKCLVQIPTLLHGLDSLADLRGAEKLCMDIIDRPDAVHKALLQLNSFWSETHELFWKIISSEGAELTDTLPLWCQQRYGVVQCDFMVNINEEMFRDSMVDDLKKCTAFLDRSLFHLDGKEATHHLDALLALEDLDCIQFQQGSTWEESPISIIPFIPMIEKIQAAGKGVYISVRPEEVEPVMRELSSRRLFLGTAAETEAEARQLEDLVAKLTHD